MTDVKIIVLMPTRGLVLTETLEALDTELAGNKQSPVVLRTWDLPLPMSRNYLVETALKQSWWTHALMLDDDVILPSGGLKELLKLNADIAVMDYPMQGKYRGKYVGTILRDKQGKIAFAGIGATLVKREVLEQMPQPWFSLTQYKINRSSDGELGFFAAQPNETMQQMSAGEDTYFFLQARKLGFVIKEAKKTAAHARVDQTVTTLHTNRYARQHKTYKNDVIEGESV